MDLREQRHESRTQQTWNLFLRDLALHGVPAAKAEQAAVAVLSRLEARIIEGEAEALMAQLPFKLQELLRQATVQLDSRSKEHRRQFVEHIAEDLKIGESEAERVVRGVFATVREHISHGEGDKVAGQLPADLRHLWVPDA